MAGRKNVSASEVRAWGREHLDVSEHPSLSETARGKIGPAVIEAFHKANKGKVYEPKVAESATITVPVVMLDKAGRKTTRDMTLTTAEARDLLGRPRNQKGRLPRADLSLALSARVADEVADTFV